MQTAKGWRRCQCTVHAHVLPILRHGEARYPATFDDTAALPLKSLTLVGDYTDARHRFWRSVLAHPGVVYDVVTAYQLVDISFQRDPKYTGIRDLIPLDLAIVTFGIAEIPHSYLGTASLQLLQLRAQLGLPTWVYVSSLGDAERDYTSDLVKFLRTTEIIGQSAPVRTSPPTAAATAATTGRASPTLL